MRPIGSILVFSLFCLSAITLSGCSTMNDNAGGSSYAAPSMFTADYSSRIPQQINTREKVVLVDPNVHVWGAYGADGQLQRAGIASAGRDFCPDTNRPCRTSAGSFRVYSLGEPDCKSRIFPLHKGGAPMPYCMFFSHGMALHGVPSHEVGEGNYSHGCVRLQTTDAEWLRYNFVNVGTKVIVKPY